MSKLLLPVAALGLATSLLAQSTQTVPQGYLNTNGTTANSWPWNNTNAGGHRCMWIYDSSHIKFSGPILINRLRWRAHANYATWAGGTHSNVTINMSTAAVDYLAASATYASNHGKDVKAVFKGNVTVTPNTHPNGRWYVEIKLPVPFLYDPSQGDLVIDYIRPGAPSGSFVPVDHLSGSGFKMNRIQSHNTSTSATGSVGPYPAITEIQYTPASGLYAGFTATPVSGKSPLKVQFTDASYSSDKGGVTKWEWDLNGDSKIDSTLQNPVYTYGAATFDKYFDVSLTVYDATHPKNSITKKQFIRVNPSTAKAEDFGKGSFNKAAPAPIQVSPYSSTYSASAGIRGYHFVSPTTLIINGFEAPNDYSTPETDQTIVCYVISTPPTAAFTPAAADVKFFQTGKANQILRPKAPIIVRKGDWVGVFGACHASAAASLFRNSYGAGPFTSSVLNQPITLQRLWMNSDARTNKGIGTVNPSTGTLARVFVHVVGNTSTAIPELSSSGRPILGTTPSLQFDGNLPTAQGGILLLGTGRMPVPVKTPFGSLLIQPPFGLSVAVANGKGTLPVPIPNDNQLKGVQLDWQGFVFDVSGGTYGMTNGTEWYLGTK